MRFFTTSTTQPIVCRGSSRPHSVESGSCEPVLDPSSSLSTSPADWSCAIVVFRISRPLLLHGPLGGVVKCEWVGSRTGAVSRTLTRRTVVRSGSFQILAERVTGVGCGTLVLEDQRVRLTSIVDGTCQHHIREFSAGFCSRYMTNNAWSWSSV